MVEEAWLRSTHAVLRITPHASRLDVNNSYKEEVLWQVHNYKWPWMRSR